MHYFWGALLRSLTCFGPLLAELESLQGFWSLPCCASSLVIVEGNWVDIVLAQE